MPFRRTLGSEEGEMTRMKRVLRTRELWASITTAVLLGAIVGLASPARATQEWHLSLNGANTTSGSPCGGSITNPWDGTGDGPDGAYEMATWAWNLGDNFIINPMGGSDPLDFTCSIQ